MFDISGNLTVCQLNIAGVEVGDHGSWTCAVSDSASLETVKQSQSLLVAVVGQLSLSPVLPSVQLGEGDLAQLVCRVTTAWPRPAITWSIDTTARLHTQTQVWTELEEDSHLVSVSQTITYTAALEDNGANITCSVSQTWGDTEELQARSVNLQILPATALRNSGDSSMVDKVGLLSLVFVSILVVVLLLVITAMLGLKRRSSKTEVYRPVHGCPGETDLLYSPPRNISYIDLYGHCSSQTEEVRHHHTPLSPLTLSSSLQAVKDNTKDSHSSSGLGSSSVSFNDTGSDCGDQKSVKTFRETHFDNYESRTLPSSQYGDQCGRPVHHAVHTLPYTLFHCQHSCFNQHQHPHTNTNTHHHHGQPA